MASIINSTTTAGVTVTGDNSGSLQLATNNGTTAVTVTTAQLVGVGTTSPSAKLHVTQSGNPIAQFTRSDSSTGLIIASDSDGPYFRPETTSAIRFNNSANTAEAMRVTNAGQLLIGKTTEDSTTYGAYFSPAASGFFHFVVTNTTATSTNSTMYLNRQSSDGRLIEFRQADTAEGDISVSGTTVSYNGGHLSRWSQLPDGSKDDTILKGTVLTNLDDMCVWTKDGTVLDNEQLNKMKVSDVEGDTNVAGVFVNWTFDEECQSDDMNVAMTGDMIIRIADGVVVQKGDLLMSAGDGTAKPQGDDIRRSKTIAKVTSNHVTCTYADGSYCVPCVLMAC